MHVVWSDCVSSISYEATEVDPFLGLGYPIDTFVECQAKSARSPELSLLVFSARVYLSVSRLQSATEWLVSAAETRLHSNV